MVIGAPVGATQTQMKDNGAPHALSVVSNDFAVKKNGNWSYFFVVEKFLIKPHLQIFSYSIEPQNCKTGGEICEELGDCCDGMTQCFGDETKKCTYLHINL